MKLSTNFFVFICATSIIPALLFTSGGVDLTPDSLSYFEIAKYFREGGSTPGFIGRFPPLYAALVGSNSLLDPLTTARLINVLSLTIAGAFVGLLLDQSGLSTMAKSFGALLWLSSVPIFYVCAMAWSEALFIAFCVVSLTCLNSWIAKQTPISLLTLTLSAAAASLTRYAGVVIPLMMMITGIYFLVAQKNRKGAWISVAAVLATLPLVLWRIFTSRWDNRALAVHPVNLSSLFQIGETFTQWFIPVGVGPIGFCAMAFGFAFLVVYNLRRSGPVRVASGFVILYLAFILFSKSFLDAEISLNTRILSPLFPAILVLLLVSTIDSEIGRRHRVIFIVPALLLLGGVLQTWELLEKQRNRDLGLVSPDRFPPEVIAALKHLPDNVLVFSNAPDFLQLLSGRQATFLPNRTNAATREPILDVHERLDDLRQALSRKEAVVVYFHKVGWRRYLVSEAELRSVVSDSVLQGQLRNTDIYFHRDLVQMLE